MRLIIGCPTRNRTWILPLWKEHVEAAIPEGVDYSFIFVVGNDDIKTIEMIGTWDRSEMIAVEEPKILEDVRSWGDTTRYEHMVFLRNTLLSYSRFKHPDYFLSLDSDILLHEDGIKNLLETAEDNQADAVGGLTYFDPADKQCTNAANWKTDNGFHRTDSRGAHTVDIIMGIKLMGPEAYNTDYKYHRLGEDLGWCDNMRGKNIYFDGRIANKHVMAPKYLDWEDPRVGY